MLGGGFFLPEQDRRRRLFDVALAHRHPHDAAHAELFAEGLLKVIIPAIDDVAAGRGVRGELIGPGIARGWGLWAITGATKQPQVLISRTQFLRPARAGGPRRVQALVLIGIEDYGQRKLTQVVHAGYASAGLFGPAQ